MGEYDWDVAGRGPGRLRRSGPGGKDQKDLLTDQFAGLPREGAPIAFGVADFYLEVFCLAISLTG